MCPPFSAGTAVLGHNVHDMKTTPEIVAEVTHPSCSGTPRTLTTSLLSFFIPYIPVSAFITIQFSCIPCYPQAFIHLASVTVPYFDPARTGLWLLVLPSLRRQGPRHAKQATTLTKSQHGEGTYGYHLAMPWRHSSSYLISTI